ncbi:type 2 lactosamine alpha-2,3-sialyltransferase-like [Oscarella lobularis]|uniref:type 2 lactosamine alpha-2,3-sialyltransferase-like n=1 Tax=Oscarella lobularis TaxID=121494 RepID=UPI0033135AFC
MIPNRRRKQATRHRLLIGSWMTSVLIVLALIKLFMLPLTRKIHSSTTPSIHRYSKPLLLSVVKQQSSRTTPEPQSSTKDNAIPTTVFFFGRSASLLSKEVLCTGARPLLRCPAADRRRMLDRVKLWQYRLANDADYASFLGRRHDTCALVGSSYSLMKKTYGVEIDAHDVVVRINDPPVVGYETHVGRRPADISIFNTALAGHRKCPIPPHNRSLLVQCSFTWNQPNHNERAKTTSNTQCIDVIWKKFGVKTFVMSRYVFSIAERALEYERVRKSTKSVRLKPSCGLKSIIFLLHLCRNLHVYGFGGTTANEPYKYYSNESTSNSYQTALHDFAGEKRFIDAFANGKLDRTEFGLSWNGIGKLLVHQ